MAITESKTIDRIEIVANGVVQVREATVIIKDGIEVAKTFHRWCIAPSEDYSDQEQKVQDICKVAHTEEAIAAYQALLEASKSLGAV
jgi:hypothetical protein